MNSAEAEDTTDGRGQAGEEDASTRRLVHDLRNEINVIGFACSALRQQVKEPAADVLRSIERIESAYGRCAALLVAHGKAREEQKKPGE